MSTLPKSSVRRGVAARARVALVALVLALPLSGCVTNWGMRRSQLGEVGGPRGADARLTVREASRRAIIEGELIAVLDSAFLVHAGPQYLLLPFSSFTAWRIGAIGGRRPDNRPSSTLLPRQARMRLMARHPHGLSAAQVRTMLELAGQPELIVLRSIDAREAISVESLAHLFESAEPMAAGHVHPDPSRAQAMTAFVDSVRVGVTALATIADAIAAGYRKLGPEFPGMGEHWVHPSLIISGRIDPMAPPVLAFARIGDEQRLVAVAFAVPLGPGEAPPEHPGGRRLWHDHSGPVDEESLLLVHPASDAAAAQSSRIAMFHLWTGLENPDGLTAQNNWRLPFEQAGLALADVVPNADAARALSLLTIGVDYYVDLFTRAEPALTAAEQGVLRGLLAERAVAVEAWRTGLPDGRVDTAAMTALEEEWGRLWYHIRRELPAPRVERLLEIAGPLPGGPAYRTSRHVPYGIHRVRAGAAFGAGFYASGQTPKVLAGTVSIELAGGRRVYFALESAGVERMGFVCTTRCWATDDDGSVLFWNAGLATPLRTFADRLTVLGAVGIGRFRRSVASDERTETALFAGLGSELALYGPLLLTFDAGTYLLWSNLDEHLPSLSLGLRAGWRP